MDGINRPGLRSGTGDQLGDSKPIDIPIGGDTKLTDVSVRIPLPVEFRPPSSYIAMQESDMRVFFHEHAEWLTARADWGTWLALGVTILLTYLSQPSFEDFVLPGKYWHVVLPLLMALALLWSGLRFWWARRQPNRKARIDTLIRELKAIDRLRDV